MAAEWTGLVLQERGMQHVSAFAQGRRLVSALALARINSPWAGTAAGTAADTVADTVIEQEKPKPDQEQE
jgi:hypothetical protein